MTSSLFNNSSMSSRDVYRIFPLSPVFATLTKNTGGGGNYCQFGNLFGSFFTLFRICKIYLWRIQPLAHSLQKNARCIPLPCVYNPIAEAEGPRPYSELTMLLHSSTLE